MNLFDCLRTIEGLGPEDADTIAAAEDPQAAIEALLANAQQYREAVAQEIRQVYEQQTGEALSEEDLGRVMYGDLAPAEGAQTLYQEGAEGPAVTRLTGEGDIAKVRTGQPVTFDFIHNTESATKHYGVPKKDAPFFRGYEPSGRYMQVTSDATRPNLPGFISGTLTLQNPLVIENNGGEWKKRLSDRYGGKRGKNLSKTIIAAGHDGVITTEPSYISEVLDLTVFDEAKAIYQGTRGSFTPPVDIMAGGDAVIRLFQAADRSTFLHESAHLFLTFEARLATVYGITEDQQTILDWLGVPDFTSIGREEHEKFAETFEVYLMTAKAPSIALARYFARFKDWLIQVYQAIKFGKIDEHLARADLTPEIKEVMDRMLATEEEIRQAAADPQYDQFFTSPQAAGKSPEEWDAYQKAAQRVRNDASADVMAKSMKAYERMRKKEWKAEEDDLADEAEARMRASEHPMERVFRARERALEAPLDPTLVKQALGRMPKKLTRFTKTGGRDPEMLSEDLGYSTPAEMLQEMASAPTIKQAARREAHARMVATYGDIFADGTLEEEVRLALHNEAEATLLLMEIKWLSKTGQEIDREYLKNEAARTVEKLTPREIRANESKYQRAEIRAAQKALMSRNDPAAARNYKIQQLANHYLYREARAARENAPKWIKFIKSMQGRAYKTTQVSQPFAQIIPVYARMYDADKTAPELRPALAQQVQKFVADQAADKNQFLLAKPEVTDHLLLQMDVNEQENAQRAIEGKPPIPFTLPTLDDMTYADLRSVKDQLKSFRHIGGQMADEAAAKVKETREHLKEEAEANGGEDWKGQRGMAREREKEWRAFYRLLNKLPNLRNLIRKLDGFRQGADETLGAFYTEVFRRVEDAMNHRTVIQRQFYERFEQEIGDIHRMGLNKNADPRTYEVSNGATYTLATEHRFMVLLYMGTETSRQRLMEGFPGMTEQDMERIVSDLTEDQLRLANAVWKINESVWPELSAAYVRLKGVAPPKLTPIPFEINGVQLTGGHMRLYYDSSRIDVKAAEQVAGRIARIMPDTTGSLIARVEHVGKPVDLDKNNITRNLNEVAHYIAFAEPAAEVMRLLTDDVKSVIEKKHGPGFTDALIDTINGVTANNALPEADGYLAIFSRLVRRAATFRYLSFSIRNALQQFPALIGVMNRVGPLDWTSAAMRMMADPSLVDFVKSRDPDMKNRETVVNREAAMYLRRMSADSGMKYFVQRFGEMGFVFQTIIDRLISFPTWLAVYEKQMELHGDDKRAASAAADIVGRVVGSGNDIRLGALYQQNQPEWIKTFTVFGSFFNNYFNEIYAATQGGTVWLSADALRTVFMTPAFVAILSALIIVEGPDPDDLEDDDKWLAWFGKWAGLEYGKFMLGMLPVVRDVASAAQGFHPTTQPQSAAGAIGKIPGVIYKAITADGGTAVVESANAAAKILATFVGVPGSGNVFRAVDFLTASMRGEKQSQVAPWWYQAPIQGPSR